MAKCENGIQNNSFQEYFQTNFNCSDKIGKLQTHLQKSAYEMFVRDCNQFGFYPSKSIMQLTH